MALSNAIRQEKVGIAAGGSKLRNSQAIAGKLKTAECDANHRANNAKN